MLRIPRRHSHFIFGVLQSGLTSAIAAAIAGLPLVTVRQFAIHWLQSWLVSWVIMLPVVIFAAPAIRRLAHALTRE